MKKLFILVSCLAMLQLVHGQDPAYPATPPALQNIVSAEYFIDADPGFGKGTAIPVSATTNLLNQPVAVSLAGLSGGVHRLWVRTRTADGRWSLSHYKEFLVDFNPAYPPVASALATITRAEYFIDTDPGIGNGTNIPVAAAINLANQAAVISTAGLASGIHHFYLRTKAADGQWSFAASKAFLVDENPAYPLPPAAPGNLRLAEYFFDTDPGFGKGTQVMLTPAVNLANVNIPVNTSTLADGQHTFYFRTLDDWSLTGYRTFVKGSVLPLRLLSFSARNNQQAVELSWTTEVEEGVSHFDIQRSADGTSFKTVGTVQARNRTGRQAYSWHDGKPLENKSFYRLKQVDKDGRYEYSKTVVVNRSATPELQVFPNPAAGFVTVTLPPGETTQTLVLLDANGQRIKQLPVLPGQTIVTLSLTDIASGTYFIRWQSKDHVSVVPLVKT